MSPTDKLVLPDDKTLQPEAGGTTITIRVSRESRRRLAAAAERSGASVEAVAEWFLEWTLLDERRGISSRYRSNDRCSARTLRGDETISRTRRQVQYRIKHPTSRTSACA